MAEKITHYGVNADGSLSVCRAKPENVGRYNCHHSEHRDMTPSQVESYYDGQAQLRRAMSRFVAKEAKIAAKSFNPRDVIALPDESGIIIPVKGGVGFTLDLQDANGNKPKDLPRFKTREEAKAFVAGMAESDEMFDSLTDDQKKTVMNLYDKGLNRFKDGVYHADATPEFQVDVNDMFSYAYDGEHDALAAVQSDYDEMYNSEPQDENYWKDRIENDVKGSEEQKRALLKQCIDYSENVKKHGYGNVPAVYQASIFTDLNMDKKSKEALNNMGDRAQDLDKINCIDSNGYDLEMENPISQCNLDAGGATEYRTFASADDAKAYLLGAMAFQSMAPEKSTLDYNFQQVCMIEPSDRKAKFSYNGEIHTLDDLQSLDGARVKFTYRNAKGEDHDTDSMIYYDPKNTRKGQILTVSMDGKGNVYKGDDGKPRYHWYKLDRMTTPIELLEKRDFHDTGRNSLSKK